MVQKTKSKDRLPVLDRSHSEVSEKNPGFESYPAFDDVSQENWSNPFKEIKKDKVDVALDISTSIIGYCVLDTSGNMLKLGNIKLTSTKFEDIYDKADEVKRQLSKIVDLNTQSIQRIFVEEAHMKFTSGASSAKTLFSLATFNGVVCHLFYAAYGIKPIKVGVRTARAKLGIKINTADKTKTTKEKVLEIVRTQHPEFPWETHVALTGKNAGQVVYGQQNFDMADAWVIGRGGQVTTSTSKKK